MSTMDNPYITVALIVAQCKVLELALADTDIYKCLTGHISWRLRSVKIAVQNEENTNFVEAYLSNQCVLMENKLR